MKNGFLKIDKEEGFTSRDVDNIIKKRLNADKVGHLGTLDPFATGLMIVAVGEATKTLSVFKEEDKTYQATLQLGKETDTLDKTGQVIKEEEIPVYSQEEIESILSSFLGKSLQKPPSYSAKWVNGVRAYDLVREGKEVNLKPVEIEIKSITLDSYDSEKGEIVFTTTVSKGTYIRVLGKDVAEKLKTIGYLSALRRTGIGSLTLEGSVKVQECSEEHLIRIEDVLTYIPVYTCYGTVLKMVYNGVPVYLKHFDSDLVFFKDDARLLALYQKKEDGKYYSLNGFRKDD